MSANPMFAFLDGKTFTLNGVEGVFQHKVSARGEALYHNPTAKGRRTVHYREWKRKLGDDWNTDLTHSESAEAAALALGY